MAFQHPRDIPADILDDAPRAVQLGRAIELALAIRLALVEDARDPALWLPGPARELLALGAVGAEHPFELCIAAAKLNRPDALLVLLDLGYEPSRAPADPSNRPEHLGWPNLLHICAQAGLCEGIERLAQLTPIDSPGHQEWTPLMRAAAKGQARAAHLLLSLGADPLAHAIHGQTPIMAAAMGDCHQILPRLLALGADPHEEDYFGMSAMVYARHHQSGACVAILEAFEIGGAALAASSARRPPL